MARADMFKNTKYFIIDMDGTFYLSGNIIEGSKDFINHIQNKGIDYSFFTNNSSNNVQGCCDKLVKMGFSVDENRVIISSFVTIDFLLKNRKGKSVYLLGNERLTADFKNAGIELVTENPDIVVLGFDTTLTYQKLWDACKYIAGGAEYIATHPDLNCPTSEGFMPDTGSMIAFIKASTGKTPMVMGKPKRYTVRYLTSLLGCSSDELVFVGDRLETDILIGLENNIKTVLVLTGVTDLKSYEKSKIKADLVVNSLKDLIDYI